MPPYNESYNRLAPGPKPYEFAPLSKRQQRLEEPVGHHVTPHNSLSGWIEGELVAKSPIHIASGILDMVGQNGTLAKAHFMSNGIATIPGSSLKGAFRSIVEAISSPISCLRITTKESRASMPHNVKTCSRKENLCPACRLFGAMGYMGRVLFRDASLLSGELVPVDAPPLFRPRPWERLYYEGGLVHGRKFYHHGIQDKRGQIRTASGTDVLQVCRQDSRFSFRVDFLSLTLDELGLLLTALGQGEPPLITKIGGNKPSCFGSIQLESARVMVHPDSALEFDTAPVLGDIAAFAGARGLVDGDIVHKLADILRYPGDDPCPDGNY